MGLKQFGAGFCTCLMLVGCAGASFPYKYYGLAAASFEGTLVGPEPKDDISLKGCEPRSDNARPCIVMFTDKFLSAKKDYLDMQNRLSDCEKNARKGH